MANNDLFWNTDSKDLKKGYIYDSKTQEYICILCGHKLEKGVIHNYKNQLLTSEKKMQYHIDEEHGGVFNFLINLNKKYTGLTDNQKEVLECFYNNMSDKEIAKELRISDSTIRNYRFKLREKEKQAIIFNILMELVSSNNQESSKLVEPHKTATMIDERYSITTDERKKILQTYFTEEGKLKTLPAKEKRKIIVLREIISNFKTNTKYTEVEINRILERIYDDHVLLRRYLIEYGFLDRYNDCSYYWVK
ncbi:MAG: DUF2087 domain-containing protein [Vallitalea sp.]|jgi:hypothetical protein|nr:DUF2087 domain-containing protein [Vallitalea sp.]